MLPICQSPREAIEAIRSAPLEALCSASWLEHEFLPSLGLHETTSVPDHLEQFRGKGLQSWQWPNQFARYLVNLSGRQIDSYLELGISHGGTFIVTNEYLRRFNPSITAVGIDMEIKPGIRAYQEIDGEITILEASTRSREALRIISGRLWGLALIDADHSEEGCWSDFQAVRDFARLVAFHDISNDVFPGVGAVWSRLTAVLPRAKTFEFIEQYPGFVRRFNRIDYGLGLVELA